MTQSTNSPPAKSINSLSGVELYRTFAERRRRRKDAITKCIAAHGDDEFADFAPAYADLVDAILATNAPEISWLVEYVDHFTHDHPEDKALLIGNLQAILEALQPAA